MKIRILKKFLSYVGVGMLFAGCMVILYFGIIIFVTPLYRWVVL